MSKDFHHAIQTLPKHSGFAVIVVIPLELGIGASVAIFEVASAFLLQPLPYKDPARLEVACYDLQKRNVSDTSQLDAEGDDRQSSSYPGI